MSIEPVIIGDATLYFGDCLYVLKTLPDSSVDSIVTDPPYELGFMGKAWDKSGIANNVDMWRECLRVLKPGGHLLAFSGSRTYHRMTCAIEDAGFDVRDQIMWIYGSGFPKSLDVSKAIDKAAGASREVVGEYRRPDGEERNYADWHAKSDTVAYGDYSIERVISAPATDSAKQWDGWGTALKPAHEPICLARKPLIGTVAANVLAHGTGALNIDGCRVDGGARPAREVAAMRGDVTYAGNALSGRVDGSLQSSKAIGETTLGRWPANVIHDGSAEVLAAFPAALGQQGPISSTAPSPKTSNVYGAMKREGEASANSENLGARRLDNGSAARFFYCAKASRADRNEGCEEFDKKPLNWSSGTQNPGSFQSEGTDKTSQNNHPTVKPTDLMRHLCRLVTPPGGVVLDPFMGSGSTGKAAALEGFKFIGIDITPEYLAIAKARIEHTQSRPVTEARAQPLQESLFA